MVDILIQPPELRRISEQLRTSAQKIEAALQAIDNDIRSLKGDKFLGSRSDKLQVNYAPKREALLKAKNIILHFAEDLNIAAGVFEKADKDKVDQLFVHDPFDKSDIDINDAKQGNLGDCYLIAAIAAVADKKPELIRDMIRDNGDGTYTVVFFQKNNFLGFELDGFEKIEITISLDGSESAYAKIGDEIGAIQETWVRVIEKAYAEWAGGYKDIEGGFPHNALEAITGIDSRDYAPSNITIGDLAEQFNNGNALTAGSLHDYKLGPFDIPDDSDSSALYKDNTLIANHAYTITMVNEENGTVTLRNPWGFNLNGRDAEVTLTFEEFQNNFSGVTVNSLGN